MVNYLHKMTELSRKIYKNPHFIGIFFLNQITTVACPLAPLSCPLSPLKISLPNTFQVPMELRNSFPFFILRSTSVITPNTLVINKINCSFN